VRSSSFARQEAGASCAEFPSRSLGTRKLEKPLTDTLSKFFQPGSHALRRCMTQGRHWHTCTVPETLILACARKALFRPAERKYYPVEKRSVDPVFLARVMVDFLQIEGWIKR